MRPWQFWWNILIVSSEYNPPRFVELIMLALAMVTLALWGITNEWPFLVLSLSYVVGSSTSILVGEAIAPSTNHILLQSLAVLGLIFSFYFFLDFFMGVSIIPHF
ncbi:hypothetical protein H6S82_23385 [Planktothrix sp. FACHB-1355]|uniref:Uncharacterized protein n=1 Tax=Aerosakkonema funiforme FACHB-1375 TaxID=2949571 RepID=A0A926VJ90_9CYAN|nr:MULTISPECIES: hypothetical protein [Oscillatoriales]MBD2184633.1 hypothetical protein [Aerosakkonema funiforme FACHB-1375]MBD3561763.1 hypothetical protein [Planktothrix sp. FACHB-1355]